MEQIINLHIEKLPEGVYLATSDEMPGLVAQGRTITETLEIARDIAKKLMEAHPTARRSRFWSAKETPRASRIGATWSNPESPSPERGKPAHRRLDRGADVE